MSIHAIWRNGPNNFEMVFAVEKVLYLDVLLRAKKGDHPGVKPKKIIVPSAQYKSLQAKQV